MMFYFLWLLSSFCFSETVTILVSKSPAFAIKNENKTLHFQATQKHKWPVVIEGDILEVENRLFRGRLEVYEQDGQLLLVHPLDLEVYLEGVVASEVPESFEKEAQKAQAIIARTYALWQKSQKPANRYYDLNSSVLDQVYQGIQKEHQKASQAVQETKGQVILLDKKVVPTYFHSTCGGHTATALETWGSKHAHTPSKPCPYCQKAPKWKWHYETSLTDVEKRLGMQNIKRVKLLGKTLSGRIQDIEWFGKTKKKLKATKVRELLGYTNMRSTLITKMYIKGKTLRIEGKGYGHGVGVCQWGAHYMAKEGKNALQIIQFYYGPQVRVGLLN